MLGDYPIEVVLLSRDLDETRRFYHDGLGLQIESGCAACGRAQCNPARPAPPRLHHQLDFFLMIRRPPRFTLFPFTTLVRS